VPPKGGPIGPGHEPGESTGNQFYEEWHISNGSPKKSDPIFPIGRALTFSKQPERFNQPAEVLRGNRFLVDKYNATVVDALPPSNSLEVARLFAGHR